MNKRIIFVWDWDDTLSTEDSQNVMWRDPEIFGRMKEKYSHPKILKELQKQKPNFEFKEPLNAWDIVEYSRLDSGREIGYLEFIRENVEDNILVKMIDGNYRRLKNEDLREFGSKIPIATGMPEFLSELKSTWRSKGVEIKNYIVSVGLTEMIKGSRIAKHFDGIYATEFSEERGYISGYKHIMDAYGGKTGALIKIAKGGEEKFNEKMRDDEYPNPYENMIIVDDGWSGTSFFQAGRKRGSTGIVVYDPNSLKRMERAQKIAAKWADYALPRDYSRHSQFAIMADQIIKRILSGERCLFSRTNLHMYAKGSLKHIDERKLVESHVKKCDDCKDTLEKFQRSYK